MVDNFDEVGVGRAHRLEDGDVSVVKTAAGGVVLLPASVKRLKGEQLEVASQIQSVAAEIGRLQDYLSEGVDWGRQIGLSWNVIGWSVGTTGEAARQRWGAPREPE